MAKKNQAGRADVRATVADPADRPAEVEFRAAVEQLEAALGRLRKWARQYPGTGESGQEAARLRDLRRVLGGSEVFLSLLQGYILYRWEEVLRNLR